MDKKNNVKRLLVLHHSHTDIGYTEQQGRVTGWHKDFIRQALDIYYRQLQGSFGKYQFKWIIECFWAVEEFWQDSSNEEKELFIRAAKDNSIGISANYLNFNELLDYPVLERVIGRARQFSDKYGLNVKSAMTADINGFGWGYAKALHASGIENLFTCTHSHHAKNPLKRFSAFWWLTPDKNKILVWNGQHYHYGNELGIMPGAVSSYITKDECDANLIYHDNWKVAEIRIPRLWEALESDAYPYDFLPVMVSGLRTDNAPPNSAILSFMEKWNQEYGERYTVEMVTLNEFFEILRQQEINIPTYKGDWPDWWTDGTACAPVQTRIFKAAQRDLSKIEKLAELNQQEINTDKIDKLLALYSEHTFSHADAMSNPFHFKVNSIAQRKKANAALDYDEVQALQDKVLANLGQTQLSAAMSLKYRVINPHNTTVNGFARLLVGHFEYFEKYLNDGVIISELGKDKKLPFQAENVPLGLEYLVPLKLKAGESKELEIIAKKHKQSDKHEKTKKHSIETDFVKIKWKKDAGIYSWYDKINEKELLVQEHDHDAFQTLYHSYNLKVNESQNSIRAELGLNRNPKNVDIWTGEIGHAKIIESGDVYCRIEFEYVLWGTDNFIQELKVYKNEARVDVSIRFNKDSNWNLENMYLSLPFWSSQSKSQIYLDKAGAIVRPRIDQLPGTLIDYYSVQNGFIVYDKKSTVQITMLDNNLLQLGPLEFGERKFHSPISSKPDKGLPYAWLMTNYWETNFDASLGGFHEFRYTVRWGKKFKSPEEAIQDLRSHAEGFSTVRLEGAKR